MKKFSTLIILLLLSCYTFAQQDEESKFGMSVSLNSDAFFGFYPFFAGSYKAGDNLDFTFYGILWSGGRGAEWGNWTEFGIGIGFPVGDALYVNPQIGILNGSLTSGSDTPVLAEGIVPNLTISLDTDKFEGELYAGYYNGFDHGNPVTNNYLHYWLNGGVKIGSFFSAGLHLEHLRFMGGQNQEDDVASDYYVSLGPYFQFADPDGGPFSRFSTGGDLRSDEEVIKSGVDLSSFFKVTVGFSF